MSSDFLKQPENNFGRYRLTSPDAFQGDRSLSGIPIRTCRRLAVLPAVVMLSLVLLFFRLSPAESSERIIAFRSDITVHKDATMTVKETIRVRAEGERIKHGIYRDFPVRYRDRLGNSYVVGFAVREVMKDGFPEPFQLQNQSNGKRVYIGREDALLPPGEYTYTLVYTTDHQLGFFNAFDELYWNVTGNGWEFPLDAVSAVIELPGDASRHIVSFAAYTGPQGAQGQDYEQSVDGSGFIRFSTTRPLHRGEGLTVAVSWPKGYVDMPSKGEEARYFFSTNPGLVAGPAGLILLLAYYLAIWIRVGKDPDPGIIVTRYTPPDGMPPAVMRFITNMGYDDKAFASALIQMAVKGHLRIREEDGTFTLSRQEGGTVPLAAEEEKVREKLFGGAKEITLEQKNHGRIRAAVNDFKSHLKLRYEQIYFVTNKGYFIAGLLLSASVMFLGGFRDAQAKGLLPMFLFLCIWLTIWSMGVTALVIQVVAKWRTVIRAHEGLLLNSAGALFLSLFSIPFVAGEIGGIVMLGYSTSALMVVVLIAVVCINYLFYHLLKAPTRAGRSMLDAIEGFRTFLSATEKDRMGRMNAPAKTPELFEKYLPYALALGVEQQWAEQFSGILSQAAAEGEARGQMPAWYSGRLWDSMSSGDFASSFGDSLSGAVASSSAPPGSSSGSGGGGSSGGGGGGGGGGGW